MELQKAEQLLKTLCDAFRMELQEGAYRTYLAAFEELRSPEIAFEAVKDLIYSSERFPAIATIRSTYLTKRNRQLDHEQRLAIEADTEAVREIPQVVKDFMARWQQPAEEEARVAPSDVLVEQPGGRCDDCSNDVAKRYLYGKFTLCTMCASSRLRVAAKL